LYSPVLGSKQAWRANRYTRCWIGQEQGQVVGKLQAMKLRQAAQIVEAGINDTLTYYRYPDAHWRRIRTNNPMERLIKEIRRRTKVVGTFPDGHSAVMLAAARLRHVASTQWGTRRYLD